VQLPEEAEHFPLSTDDGEGDGDGDGEGTGEGTGDGVLQVSLQRFATLQGHHVCVLLAHTAHCASLAS